MCRWGIIRLVSQSDQVSPSRRRSVGKRIASNLYVHASALSSLPAEASELVERARRLAALEPGTFDVVRIDDGGASVSFLAYPGFFDEAFPCLSVSHRVDMATGAVAKKVYDGANPPILHRKETLLPKGDPRRAQYEKLTRQAESVGLFEDPTTIGTKLGWQARLTRLRLRVDGHRLVEQESAPPDQASDVTIQRHRTALQRYSLSTPMQALWRHGYLHGSSRVFDYGCGRGDDIKILQEQGVPASGWDPHFRPAEQLHSADVVNLGFVINVIEDPGERREALSRAFALAKKVVAVSALIGGRSAYEQYRLFRDGVVTTRGTFQKYYTQQELRDYLEEVLGREPVAVAPGIFFVFKDDAEEQTFLASRQTKARCTHNLPRPPTERRVRESKWDRHRELVDDFWTTCLEFGRLPTDGEYRRMQELRAALGSPKAVLRRLQQEPGAGSLESARAGRMEDLQVYLALNLFERRRSFRNLPETLRRDISTFWGSWSAAQKSATDLLFSLAKPEVIRAACASAAAKGVGYVEDDHDLQLHCSLVTALPPVLRIYIGCAARIYGEVDSADIIKIHIESGKLTLTTYRDFDDNPLPQLIERVKINLRTQAIQFFDYLREDQTQVLYHKSRFIPESHPDYARQRKLDDALLERGLVGLASLGPPLEVFRERLRAADLQLNGFDLKDR